MTTGLQDDSRWRRPILAGLLLLTALLGARGITDEAAVMLGGDMARYIMNGVFMYDVAAQGGVWSYDELVRFAEHYYARYPALSLGHHPPLPSMALLPFFAVFGLSLTAARIGGLVVFVLTAWAFYALARRLFGWQAASWTTALFVTNPMVTRYGQRVLSEIPMVLLVLATLLALLRYCDTRRRRDFALFVTAAVASLYAKQLAAFMFPVYGVVIFARLGWRNLLTPRMLLMLGLPAALFLPIAAMTLGFSPSNVNIALTNLNELTTGTRVITTREVLGLMLTTHLSLPVMVLCTAGLARSIGRRDGRAALPVLWIGAVYLGCVLFAGGLEPARYAYGALPAYYLLAAPLATGLAAPAARGGPIAVPRWGVAALAAAVLWQGWLVRPVVPTGAGGYERAVEYVLAQGTQPAILFDSEADTGYFVFFMRKHDRARRHLVLRADKVIPHGGRRDEPLPAGERAPAILGTIQRLGVEYVVVETRRTGPPMLMALHETLASDRFVLRERIPVETLEYTAQDIDLLVYQYLDARPPDWDAPLGLDIPLGGREIHLRLRDLVDPGAR